MKTMTVLGFIAVMAATYFVVPIALPSAEVTLTQSAAITLLAFVARVVLFEGANVKVDDMKMIMYNEVEDEE